MKVLVVFVHPLKLSFCRSVLDSVVKGLVDAGHEYQIADLNREKFQSSMVEADFAQFQGKDLPDEILSEQKRVEWSDALIFIFPIWWWSMPAILKGWIDRVMSYGWAYEDPKDPDSGYLKPRNILVLATAGGSKQMFRKRKYDEAIYTQINVGTWDYCNFKNAQTEIFYGLNSEQPRELGEEYLKQAYDLSRNLISDD